MWVKLIVPDGVSTVSGYLRLDVIGALDVRQVNSPYYITGELTNSDAFGNTTNVYLDPAYSTQADAEAALSQLVDTGGLLVP